MKSVRPVVNHTLDATPFAGAPVFDMATVQKTFFSTVKLTTPAQKRGMAVFTGTPQHPACIVCHNAPETLAGGTRLFASDNIGEENVQLRLHAPDAATKALMTEFGYGFEAGENDMVQKLPMQTIRLKNASGGYEEVTAQDFGLAGQTGLLKDLHQYKIPQLRNVKTYTRFFHDNYDETELSGVVPHYRDAFPGIFGTLTDADRDDLVEFLKAL
jgi:cytochrome c peroxidase